MIRIETRNTKVYGITLENIIIKEYYIDSIVTGTCIIENAITH
jgi:hypothetical protein